MRPLSSPRRCWWIMSAFTAGEQKQIVRGKQRKNNSDRCGTLLWSMQEPSNSPVIEAGANQTSEQRPGDRDDPIPTAIRQTIVAKADCDGEQSRAKVARGIYCVSVHAAEAHADRYDYEADHQRSHVRARRHIEFV